jgi:hypothetical protein
MRSVAAFGGADEATAVDFSGAEDFERTREGAAAAPGFDFVPLTLFTGAASGISVSDRRSLDGTLA